MSKMNDNNLLLVAFDDVGGSDVQPQALQLALEKRGVGPTAASAVVREALQSGVLVVTGAGSFRLKTK